MQNLVELKNLCGVAFRGFRASIGGALPRVAASLLIAVSLVTPGFAPPVEAAGQTRTLKLFFIHTKEKAAITYKRNGRYDAKGLQQINRLLRDWRRNEPTKMDPRLLDLVWEVYQKAGARDYIHVVSAYRSPATNGMLRSRSKGVAKTSQHMLGKAMDFYIPGVKLKTLREVGMKFQVGGVGYYPTSGSPFVHMDVGGVRAWPRMNRTELARLFPDGKTIHLPSDGKPLPGYQQAIADYKRRVGANAIEVAGGGTKGPGDEKKKKNFLLALFSGGDEDEEPSAIASGEGAVAEAEVAAPPVKATALVAENKTVLPGVDGSEMLAIKAPVPGNRPAFNEAVAAATELAAAEPDPVVETPVQTASIPAVPEPVVPEAPPEEQYADLSTFRIPVPDMIGKRGSNGDAIAELLTASAEVTADDEMVALGFVPVPANRPAGEEALAAVAQAEIALPMAPERPEMVASASEPADLAAVATAKVALAKPVVGRKSIADQPIEMAAFAPQPSAMSGASVFDSVFNSGAVEPVDVEPPAKGKRPKKVDAENASSKSVLAEPKLTQKMISEWALSTGRMATLSRPVKAPRFVSRSLRKAPTTVYAAGFNSTASSTVDTARFSGTAVNFMEVQKFETN